MDGVEMEIQVWLKLWLNGVCIPYGIAVGGWSQGLLLASKVTDHKPLH